MAATNYTPIQLYYSTTASTAPSSGNLANGELAINITDGKLYYKDNGGVVQVIATKGSGSIGGSTTQIQYNNAGALAGNAAMTFNSGTNVTTLTTLNLTNALGATYGGTAQSAYTQGDILYSSATNTLSKLGIGTVNYILTSSGSVPQWVAPTSIVVQTANNLAGGLAGSVPYQSALDTTTFLAIGAANRVMSSTGSAPQWVTSLTGLTGVSSSSITNTSLTSGRVVISSTAGLESDSANLTFNGTTLSTTGLSNTGFSTLVKTLTLGDSSFNGTAVFAAATPAKLYLGTGTVTDVTSAISATNGVGAIASLAITPIAATNTGVTYTNASTLYIAGAPSAGTNITITNPYSLYVAAGAAYFGGAVTVAGSLSLAAVTVTSLTDSGLTSGRVTYAGTGGLLQDSANLTFSGSALAVTGTLSATNLISSTFDGAGNPWLSRTGATTNAQFIAQGNTGGVVYAGIETAAGGTLITGATGYSFVFRSPSTPIQFSANGGTSPQMTLDSSGNLLVGATSAYLSTFSGITAEGKTSGVGNNLSLGLSKAGTPQILNGDVLGNIYFYGVDNDVSGGNNNIGARIASIATTDWTTDGTTSNAALVFYTHGTISGAPPERARIGSNGYSKFSNVGTYNNTAGNYHEFRGDTSNSYVVVTACTNATPLSEYIQDFRFSAATPNDGNARFWNCEDATANRAYMLSNGGLANYAANNVILSDRREKTNFAPATSYLDKICAIPVQTFNYIDQNMEEDGGLTLGVVAQDVQAVAPELVTEGNWGSKEEPKMRLEIYQTDLQYALMKCIQEQQAIITQLTARITALETA